MPLAKTASATRKESRLMAKLAIIAGQGALPAQIAEMASNMGHAVLIMPIEGQADADFPGFESLPIRLGKMGATLAQMKAHGVSQMVMVGKVVRPSMTALSPDATALKLLGKAVTRGDDSLLRIIRGFFADAGIETLAPDLFLPDRVAPSGLMAGVAPDAAIAADLALAIRALQALGDLDVGQAAITQDGRVIAIEAAEGTNEMIRRSAALIDPDSTSAVLVKMPKTGQDAKLDIPTIGSHTLAEASKAGIGCVAVQAGQVLFADSVEVMCEACKNGGITLLGFTDQVG